MGWAGLELEILLSQPWNRWNYGHVLLYLAPFRFLLFLFFNVSFIYFVCVLCILDVANLLCSAQLLVVDSLRPP